MVIYLALVVPAALLNAERLNPDGVCYIRLARYLAAGRFYDGVSIYWSPVLTWCLAPLVALGFDGLHAGRLVLAGWGGTLVLASGLLLRRLTVLPAGWAGCVAAFVAAGSAHWATWAVTPDVAVAACLVLYFAVVSSPRLLDSRRTQLAGGLLAGLSYLAKHYALPFVLVHLVLVIGLRYSIERRKERLEAGKGHAACPGRPVSAWLVAMLGLILTAGPWIAVLTWKFRHLTFSSAGPINHALVSPANADRQHPHTLGLWLPQPGRIHIWETPEAVDYRDWSPFENRRHFLYQVESIGSNILNIRKMFLRGDLFALSLAVLGGSPVLGYILRRRPEELFRLFFFVGTVVTYCAGYLIFLLEDRYIMPVLWPVACGTVFHLGWLLRTHIAERAGPDGLRRGPIGAVALAVLIVSLGAGAVRLAAKSLAGQEGVHRRLAGRLTDERCRGPLAGTRFPAVLYVACHMDEVCLGRPAGQTPAECERELDLAGARTFLVWPDSTLHGLFSQAGPWTLAARTTGFSCARDEPIEVYVRKADR